LTRRNDKPRGAQLPGLVNTSGLLTNRPPSYRSDDLNRRRTQRQAEVLVAELRELLAAYDTGCIPFEVLACTVDVVGARLADIAIAGWAA
jgi:hypothetical protein